MIDERLLFSNEAECGVIGALLIDHDAANRLNESLVAEHFYRDDHRRIFAAVLRLIAAGRACDIMAVFAELEESGDAARCGGIGYLGEIADNTPSSANMHRYTEIVIERATLRSMRAAGDEIAQRAVEPGMSAAEKVDFAQSRVLRLTESVRQKFEPVFMRDAMRRQLARMAERMDGTKAPGLSTGFPDLDKRSSGGLHPGQLIILAARPAMGKAQPLDAKILFADGVWRRMGDVAVGDAIASVDGAESRVIGVFPQGVKKVFRVTFSDGRSAVACKEHLWSVMYRDWPGPRVVDTGTLIEMLGKSRYKNRLSVDVVSGDFGGGQLPLDPYVLGVLLGDGCMTKGTVRLSSADAEIVDEVRRRLGSSSEVRKSSGKYDYRIVSMGVAGRLYKDGCRLPYGRRYPRELGHNMLHMHRPKVAHPVREALELLGLAGLGSGDKFIPEVYFSASKEDRLDLLRGLMDTDGWAEAHGSVRFTSSSKALSEGVQRLVRSLGGLCSIAEKRTTFVSNGEKKSGMIAWICKIRHERAEGFFKLERKATRAIRGRNASVRLNVSSIDECGETETQCIQVSHPSRLYVTDNYVVTHNTALAMQIALHFALNDIPSLVCSQEMPESDLMNRIVALHARVELNRVIDTRTMHDDDWDRLVAASGALSDAPLAIDEQPSLNIMAVRNKVRRVRREYGRVGLLVVDYLQLMVGDGSEQNRNGEIEKISRGLKQLAKEEGMPVLALSQLNREVEKRPNKRPMASDLRDSGAIEQDADVIWTLYRDEVYHQEPASSPFFGYAELGIQKNRQGAAGGFVGLAYRGALTRFESVIEWPRVEEKSERSGRRKGFGND